jgi:hypothetical protein
LTIVESLDKYMNQLINRSKETILSIIGSLITGNSAMYNLTLPKILAQDFSNF